MRSTAHIHLCRKQCYSDISKQSQYHRTLDVFNTDVKRSGPNACRLLRLIPDAGACSALSYRCLEILRDTLMVIVHACTRLKVRERRKLVTVTCWSHAGFPRRKASLALPSVAPCHRKAWCKITAGQYAAHTSSSWELRHHTQ